MGFVSGDFYNIKIYKCNTETYFAKGGLKLWKASNIIFSYYTFSGGRRFFLVSITLDRKLKGCCRFWLKRNHKVSPKLSFAFYVKNILSDCPIRLSFEKCCLSNKRVEIIQSSPCQGLHDFHWHFGRWRVNRSPNSVKITFSSLYAKPATVTSMGLHWK